VGHAYSVESFLENQSEALESAFWTVLRSLEECVALHRRLLLRAKEKGHDRAVDKYQEEIIEIENKIRLVRQALFTKESEPASKDKVAKAS
jgi:two-component system chemotaxis response regulator CheB